MVTKLQKEQTVQELKQKFEKASAVYTADQIGLSVEQITNLRGALREVDAEFKIAKNTLIGVAAKGTQFEELTAGMTGPSALLFCYDESIAPAGKLKTFSKENDDKIQFKGGILDGELLDAEKVSAVANLPSKETLLSQIAGMLVASPSSIAYIVKELSEKEGEDKLLSEFVVVSDEAESTESKDEGDAA